MLENSAGKGWLTERPCLLGTRAGLAGEFALGRVAAPGGPRTRREGAKTREGDERSASGVFDRELYGGGRVDHGVGISSQVYGETNMVDSMGVMSVRREDARTGRLLT